MGRRSVFGVLGIVVVVVVVIVTPLLTLDGEKLIILNSILAFHLKEKKEMMRLILHLF